MKITVKGKKLKAALDDEALCRRRYGAQMAKKLKLRMDALGAAETLADLWPPLSGPERCHALKADLAGTFSVDVVHPYRLLFVPVDVPPAAESTDEKQRWHSITSIEIIEIKDTHG
jgi:plasmid maintenance system killer protein